MGFYSFCVSDLDDGDDKNICERKLTHWRTSNQVMRDRPALQARPRFCAASWGLTGQSPERCGCSECLRRRAPVPRAPDPDRVPAIGQRRPAVLPWRHRDSLIRPTEHRVHHSAGRGPRDRRACHRAPCSAYQPPPLGRQEALCLPCRIACGATRGAAAGRADAGIDSRNGERLLAALDRFPGAMLPVSHDDAFIARLATRAMIIRDQHLIPVNIHYSPDLHRHPHVHSWQNTGAD